MTSRVENNQFQLLHQTQKLRQGTKMLSSKNREKQDAEKEDINYTVYVKLPFDRGDFVDPPPVCFSHCAFTNRHQHGTH